VILKTSRRVIDDEGNDSPPIVPPIASLPKGYGWCKADVKASSPPE